MHPLDGLADAKLYEPGTVEFSIDNGPMLEVAFSSTDTVDDLVRSYERERERYLRDMPARPLPRLRQKPRGIR